MIRLTIAVLLFLPTFVHAQTSVTNTFQNGATADANEVNENFQDLANAIDNIVEPPTNCSTNQIIKWNGSTWACANETTSSGGLTLQSVRDAVDVRSTTSTAQNVIVYCNSGEKVTGGGYRDDAGGAAPTLCQPFVPSPGGASTDGYRCKWANSGASRTVYAVCL